ncbi:MAG: hypothetical protein WCT39_06495, partial [Candidatus Margulisiibacteriota bacterium]
MRAEHLSGIPMTHVVRRVPFIPFLGLKCRVMGNRMMLDRMFLTPETAEIIKKQVSYVIVGEQADLNILNDA